MFWLCTRRLGNISCIHPHFRAFATAQDVLVGSNGRINGVKYSINSFQGLDSLPPNEYRGFLGDEPVSIHVVANWEVANGWRQLSAMCGSKYFLEPKLVHEVGSGDILVFTRKVDCSLEQWCHDNKPLVDSDKFIIPRLRVIYRDIAEALLQVMERTGKCHGNVTSHYVKMINGNAFLSCPAANWIGMSLSDQMDASMFKLFLDAAHPEKTAEASEEVTYFMKALDSTNYSTLSFLIGHHPIFRTLEGKMELWLLLSRLTLEFKGEERELEPSYVKLCEHWDRVS